ncbi:MAG: RNA methyltransferase [Acidobacteria bacterium]|nr:RNA methyltransferase [Acidobacteriota bacterium]
MPASQPPDGRHAVSTGDARVPTGSLILPVPVITIGDATDRRLDDYRNVPDSELLRRRGLFVAEGRLVVRRLLAERRFLTRSVMVTEAARASLDDVLGARPDVPVYVVPLAVMNGITGFNIHRGCLAIGERPQPTPWTDVVSGARTVVVLERVANADNIGGVFRNAAAFGAGAVLLDAASTDPLYRKSIRTSMGAALTVPFARAEPWPGVLLELGGCGFATVALTPASSAPPIDESMKRLARQPVALVLGHEGEGLTDGALDSCSHRARIPMAPHIDSLNVASAAAVALYERSRRIV